MGDYGLKISKLGIDVETAQPYEYYFHSSYFNLKEKASGSFNFKTGVKTALDDDLLIGQTTVSVDPETTDYPNTGVIAIVSYDFPFPDVEYVKYGSKDSRHFYNCTRGYWGSTERNWTEGGDIYPALTKRTIYTHDLGYYPAAYCHLKSTVNNYMYPLPLCTIFSTFYYYMTTTTIEAVEISIYSFEYGGMANTESHYIYYHCMYDKIKS